MVPWRGFVTLKNLAEVWGIISLLLSISSYWHATVAQEWCWIDKKLHFFSSSLKLAMCCFLKRLLEWCVPGLISLLSDELVLCCYSLTLYLSAYFLCSVCRKMILLSTQRFRIVDIQSFVTFYPVMPWSLQEMDDIIFPFVRALKLFAIVLKACFYFKIFVSFRTLKYTLWMVLISFFPWSAWALLFRPSDNLSESWKY